MAVVEGGEGRQGGCVWERESVEDQWVDWCGMKGRTEYFMALDVAQNLVDLGRCWRRRRRRLKKRMDVKIKMMTGKRRLLRRLWDARPRVSACVWTRMTLFSTNPVH